MATTASGVLLAGGLLAIVPPAQAAPGDLDASFSGDGRQLTDFGGWEVPGFLVRLELEAVRQLAEAGEQVDGRHQLHDPFVV